MSLLLDALQRSEKRPLSLAPTDDPAVALAPSSPAEPTPTAGAFAPVGGAQPPVAPPIAATPAHGAAAVVTADTARQAAQAMVGTAASGHASASIPAPQARVRRLVAALLGGMFLAVVTWFGWQYWQTTQTSMVLAAPSVPQPVGEGAGALLSEQAAGPAADAASAADTMPSEGGLATATPVPAESGAMALAAHNNAVSTPDPSSAAPGARPRAATPEEPSPRRAPAVAAAQASVAPTQEAGQPVQPPSAPRSRAATAERKEAVAQSRPASPLLVRSEAQRHLQNAWTALGQGDVVRAQALYQQVLAERPDDPDATLGLAVALHRQRQLEPAWMAYQRSLHLWPDNETARTGLLSILSESDPATAESRLQEWVQTRPRDAAAQSALGNLLGRQGRWADALGPLTLAQSLAPERAAHAYNLAVVLDQSRRYAEALRMYRLALQIGGTGIPVKSIEHRLDDLQEQLTR